MKLEIILCIIFLGAAFSAKVASTIKSFPNPDRVLSRDGFHVLNLFTDTAYTISNKGTGKLACFNSSLLSPDLLNLSHWWKIVPSRNFSKREPRYELVNFDGKGCDIGKTISFYSAPSSLNETDDTFLLSTEHCGKIKSCSGNGQIYNGLMYLDQANTSHFCGDLGFKCVRPLALLHQSQLQKVTGSGQTSNDSFHFKFVPYSSYLTGKYDVVGKLQDLVLENVTQKLGDYTKSQEIEEGWRIGFADEITNCAAFTQKKEVNVAFTSVESSRLEFYEESFQLLNKINKFSIRAGGSLALSWLARFIPILDVSSGVEWGTEVTKWSQHSRREMKEVTKKVKYQYTSRIMIKPWRVAKVSAFLNVVKNLPIGYEGMVAITAGAVGDEGVACLGKEKVRKILTLVGYDLNGTAWNETFQSFGYPLKGDIIVSFGVESYVQVTDKECPRERQVLRSEF